MSGTVARRQRAVRKRGPSAEAFSALVVEVLLLARALEAAGDVLAEPVGQSSARWQVMAAIEDEPAPVAGIARGLAHTRQSVQRVGDALAAEDLARYVPNPAHRRAKLLELTPRGLSALHAIQRAQVEWATRIAEGLGPAELDAARGTLAALAARLAADGA